MGDAPQSDKPRVTLVVEPKLKQRIDEAAEEEYGSIAEVVRTAVRHELDVVEEPSQPSGQSQVGLSEEASKRLARIEEAVETANERLENLESETRGSGPIYDLQKVLYNYVLPILPDPELAEGRIDNTVPEIARTIDADEDDLETALERLDQMTDDVWYSLDDDSGTKHWYREGGES
jgi:uncharacterized protein (DUF1778 family)